MSSTPSTRRDPAKNSTDSPSSATHYITRGIQSKRTDILFQAALEIYQFIHEWHEERDRLEAMMDKRKMEYNDKSPDGPDNKKWSPKEREKRGRLMDKIRGYEKKLSAVVAELEHRGVSVPF